MIEIKNININDIENFSNLHINYLIDDEIIKTKPDNDKHLFIDVCFMHIQKRVTQNKNSA